MSVGDVKMSLTSSYSCLLSLLVTSLPLVTWQSSFLLTCDLTCYLSIPVKSYHFPLAKEENAHSKGKKIFQTKIKNPAKKLFTLRFSKKPTRGRYMLLKSLRKTCPVLIGHFVQFLNVEQKKREEQKARIWLRGSGRREKTEIKEGKSLKKAPESQQVHVQLKCQWQVAHLTEQIF